MRFSQAPISIIGDNAKVPDGPFARLNGRVELEEEPAAFWRDHDSA